MNNYQKYLKYKYKYIDLNKQHGGISLPKYIDEKKLRDLEKSINSKKKINNLKKNEIEELKKNTKDLKNNKIKSELEFLKYKLINFFNENNIEESEKRISIKTLDNSKLVTIESSNNKELKREIDINNFIELDLRNLEDKIINSLLKKEHDNVKKNLFKLKFNLDNLNNSYFKYLNNNKYLVFLTDDNIILETTHDSDLNILSKKFKEKKINSKTEYIYEYS